MSKLHTFSGVPKEIVDHINGLNRNYPDDEFRIESIVLDHANIYTIFYWL